MVLVCPLKLNGEGTLKDSHFHTPQISGDQNKKWELGPPKSGKLFLLILTFLTNSERESGKVGVLGSVTQAWVQTRLLSLTSGKLK
jgi:hypothetical protein